jgi:hypothetical protein
MARDDGRAGIDTPNGSRNSSDTQTADTNDGTERSSMWQVLNQAVMAWWQHHPVQLAVDIGRPFLGNCARDKPLQLLGIAAGMGAAAVFIKPWRLVSVTGLVVAALKSTKLSTTLLSLLPRASRSRHSGQTRQPLKDAQ